MMGGSVLSESLQMAPLLKEQSIRWKAGLLFRGTSAAQINGLRVPP